MAGPLILSLQYEEQLPSVVRDELQNLIAGITNWASQINLGQGNLSIDGIGTFLGQPRCRLFTGSNQSIANDTDTVMTWGAATQSPSLEEYDENGMFDGSHYIICKEPGLYIAQAEVQWASNATGNRRIGIHPRVSAIDYLNSTESAASAVVIQNIVSHFPVIKTVVATPYVPFPLAIGVMVYQNSGGALNVATGASFGVWKVS